MKEKRLKRVLGFLCLIICAGLLYAIFVKWSGIAVPCLFHRVTGLKCPGCGITQMCIALLHLDFRTAFYSNQMLFCLFPVLGLIFFKYIADYVKTGQWRMGKLQSGIIYVSIALLLIFAVIRNICQI